MNTLYANHPRRFGDNHYVYAVISRRSRGLSIGLNINPDAACNFDCIYCQVDREKASYGHEVDLAVMQAELDAMLDAVADGSIWEATPFHLAPAHLRRLSDIAFSGDGEPTGAPRFSEAARQVVDTVVRRNLTGVKLVTITNSTLLHRQQVLETLDLLHQHGGEVWAKLDAGTQGYLEKINRCHAPIGQIIKNILTIGRRQPIVIQSMFARIEEQPMPAEELLAYIERLRELQAKGCQIRLVQAYTLARCPREGNVTAIDAESLMDIAERIGALGIDCEVFPAPA